MAEAGHAGFRADRALRSRLIDINSRRFGRCYPLTVVVRGSAMEKTQPLTVVEKALLRKARLLADLPAKTQRQIAELATGVVCPQRAVLFQEGTPADAFYCVLTGYVRLYRTNKAGREADIRVCGPGDSFAECLLWAGGAYRYCAQAAEATTLARFDIAALRDLAERDSRIGRAFLASMSAHLLDAMDRLANDRLDTAPRRLAHYLVESCQSEGPSASLRLPFQKSLLAGQLGLAPEALSRAFSTLRGAGVTVRGRIIEINDVVALRQV